MLEVAKVQGRERKPSKGVLSNPYYLNRFDKRGETLFAPFASDTGAFLEPSGTTPLDGIDDFLRLTPLVSHSFCLHIEKQPKEILVGIETV